MDIIKFDVYRGPNIGIYTKVNDEFVFVPNGFASTKSKKLSSQTVSGKGPSSKAYVIIMTNKYRCI